MCIRDRRATCLGGYEYSPKVAGGCSPDLADGSDMPLSYLFTAPRSNTKTYLHAGDQVRVLYRKSMDIGHGDGTTTKATWYGIEVAASQCPLLCPIGTRGWVMAYSELSLIHISEPTRLLSISYAVFC